MNIVQYLIDKRVPVSFEAIKPNEIKLSVKVWGTHIDVNCKPNTTVDEFVAICKAKYISTMELSIEMFERRIKGATQLIESCDAMDQKDFLSFIQAAAR